MGGAVFVKGRWKKSGEEICVINVYASCCRVEMRCLWEKIADAVIELEGMPTCVIGDINSIVERGERIRMSIETIRGRDESFVNFLLAVG